MLKPVIDYVIIIFERTGDFGLIFFLGILIINLYSAWYAIPKKMQSKIQINPTKLRASQQALSTLQTVINIVSSIFLIGIVLAPGPALWLKMFSGILAAITFLLLMFSIWLLINKKFQSTT